MRNKYYICIHNDSVGKYLLNENFSLSHKAKSNCFELKKEFKKKKLITGESGLPRRRSLFV